jgi:hypothetical protein
MVWLDSPGSWPVADEQLPEDVGVDARDDLQAPVAMRATTNTMRRSTSASIA